jgi:uncharacterized protein involved in response to NO
MIPGRLLAQIGILFYILFTLLPESSTQILQFPWVLLAEVGLGCFAIAGLLNIWRRAIPFHLLGNGLDCAIAFLFIALTLSTIFATFPDQALWYSATAVAFFVAIYVVNNYLHSATRANSLVLASKPKRTESRQNASSPESSLLGLLFFQGILSIGLILESLCLWTTQTLLPKLAELRQINLLGLNLTYDFSDIELRNGVPLGHQNYLAGYLMLAIPLFTSLAIAQKGLWRIIWIVGIGLGLIDLYTTNSRGGLIGLLVLLGFGTLVMILRSSINRWLVLGSTGAAIALAGLSIAFNQRLQSGLINLVSLLANFNLQALQGGGELWFRAIAVYTGWQIGAEHWLFGAGPGSTTLLYQQYRPSWAGREAEIVFQLHNTPAQLWAELGSFGIVAAIILLVALVGLFVKFHYSPVWRSHSQDRTLTYGLFGSLLGFGAIALTDYQLDVLAIAGYLSLLLASLAHLGQTYTRDLTILGNDKLPRLWLSGISTIYLVGAIAWLIPINIAWQSSNVGFVYLSKARAEFEANRQEPAIANLAQFQQRLQFAHALAPWESYYSLQLGWNLADISFLNSTLPQAQEWRSQGLEWIRKGIAANPNNEFGYNAAAWIALTEKAYPQAEQFFRRGLELFPAKRSLSFGLGVSLLRQNKIEAGIQAIAREVLNDPISMTSPRWTEAQWQPLIPQVMAQYDLLSDRAMKSGITASMPANLKSNLKLSQAALHWWVGNPNGQNELKATGNPTAILLAEALALPAQGTPSAELEKVKQNPQTPAQMAISAWLNPTMRLKLLEKAYALVYRTLPNPTAMVLIQAMSDRMNLSPSFDIWLRQPLAPNSPLNLHPRRARENFGIISRHIDGPIPLDFSSIQENAIVSTFFAELFPTQGGF